MIPQDPPNSAPSDLLIRSIVIVKETNNHFLYILNESKDDDTVSPSKFDFSV